MERALALAAYAAEQDEVPIGAVVVNPENGEIVSEAITSASMLPMPQPMRKFWPSARLAKS